MLTLKDVKYMLDWQEQVLDKGWHIEPAGGLTGDAFYASKGEKRLFLKRNSSPFLAVLSAEGIVPKLIWTKRTHNGDVITAQKWVEGRKLKPDEMKNPQVADLLYKIHHSSELQYMLMKLGKTPVTSDDSFFRITTRIKSLGLHVKHDEVRIALDYLGLLLPKTRNQKLGVCHCDLNHNNLILTKDRNIFLVDWDHAMVADPILDYGMLLNWYIPKKDWDKWLTDYGIEKDEHLFERMYWYLLLDTLQFLCWHMERKEPEKTRERMEDLKVLIEQISPYL